MFLNVFLLISNTAGRDHRLVQYLETDLAAQIIRHVTFLYINTITSYYIVN